MKESSKPSFLGTGWAFPVGFSSTTGGVKMSEREEDIRQSLMILFSTVPGERTLRPDYGCNLRRMLFETLTETVKAKIQDEIRRAVLLFEPRIDLLNMELDASHETEGKILIHLEYMVRSINARSNMVYPFYFIEGSDIAHTPLAHPVARKAS